jgi:hypothetical protein
MVSKFGNDQVAPQPQYSETGAETLARFQTDAIAPTQSLYRQAQEQDASAMAAAAKDNVYSGMSQFFAQDLTKNLIGNVSQAIARGNAMADSQGRQPLGTVGEIDWNKHNDPTRFWLSSKDGDNVGRYVLQDMIAFGQDPKMMNQALGTLNQVIDAQAHGKVHINQQDFRQLCENAAIMTMGKAELEYNAGNHAAAEKLIKGSNYSVQNLAQLAGMNGASTFDMWQLKKMADEISKTPRDFGTPPRATLI